VTFGGGITIVYGGFDETSAWKKFFSSQYLYHFASTSAGEYVFANDTSDKCTPEKSRLFWGASAGVLRGKFSLCREA
jgi:hypothetical protein